MTRTASTIQCRLRAPGLPDLWVGGQAGRGRIPLVLTDDGIDGWWSAPSAKTSLTELQSGDGAHTPADEDIVYSARTIIINYAVLGDRHTQNEARDAIGMFMGRAGVTLTVYDAGTARQATGYVTPAWSGTWVEAADTGSITIVCADPLKYDATPTMGVLEPGTATVLGGLTYPADYPVDYHENRSSGGSWTATLVNHGNHAAYPTLGFTLAAGHSGTVGIKWDDGLGGAGRVACSPPPGSTTPIIADTRHGTASYAGLDMTPSFTARQWPTIPPGQTLTLTYEGAAGGRVTYETRGTYI
ncbi:hypothetical protein PSRA_0799 [Pseudoscardovia radai]|uniref:Uncharacterized protein n=1 Tax=Pseudoscardovia radai TaxID=987066 RepID=A0A261EXX0_9BIFI|nr:hypothetical protein [Pseudoscardovia radai]OZG51719.1 hypothetical protein PSRA_0799 [Pseudoscardovia radai]